MAAGAAAVLAAAALGVLLSERRRARQAYETSRQQLRAMEQKGTRFQELSRAVEESRPDGAAVETSQQSLIPYLETEARRQNVQIRSIDQRPDIETRRSVLNRTRVITEQQLWIQVTEAKLKDLVLFLHSVETQRPDFFVKEMNGLSPNPARGDSWRVRVILSRLKVTEEDGAGPGGK